MTRRCAICTARLDERCPKCNSPKNAMVGHGKPLDGKYPHHDRIFKCMACGQQFQEGEGGIVSADICPKCEAIHEANKQKLPDLGRTYAQDTHANPATHSRGGIRGGTWQNNPSNEEGHPPKELHYGKCEACNGTGRIQILAGPTGLAETFGEPPNCPFCDGRGERRDDQP